MTKNEALKIIKLVLSIAADFEITVNGEDITEKCREASEIITKTVNSSEKERQVFPPEILNCYIGAEVLDKIKAEMHATAEKHEDGYYYLRDHWIDEIIDKYK